MRFNQIDGPRPLIKTSFAPATQFRAVGDYLYDLINVEGVRPEDICLLNVGKAVKEAILGDIAKRLKPLRVDV